MKKIFQLTILLTFCIQNVNAQSRYIVRFTNKGTNPFSLASPIQYLSQRAIDRRTRYNIALDSTDLPVTPRYIDSVRLAGAVTILNASKWLNQVTIRTTDMAAINKINSLPFVMSTQAVAQFGAGNTNTPVNKILDGAVTTIPENINSFVETTTANFYNYGKANGQIKIHQGEFLHNHGFRGQNMNIGILDAGFFHYKTLPTFDSLRANNQILNTWDFVANNPDVDEDDTHGMNCLSGIGANLPNKFVGTAPKANFCLYRTEDVASETKIEEHNLAAGFERSDSIGVDVCSVSLGYFEFDNPAQNYTYANMNGNTTISAIAADLAAKKGMLPVVAAGNEGNGPWHYIITPADGDSVLAVGAVDTLGNVANFSSYGPSSNGRVKPNLAAVGRNAVVANPSTGDPVFSNGTSFATPNLAGLTTCLWQAFPEFNNIAILNAMQQSANKFTAPNDRTGYGIPDMKKSFALLLKQTYKKQIATNLCTATVQLTIKQDSTMQIIIERKRSNDAGFTVYKTIAGTNNFSSKTVSFTDDFNATTITGTTIYKVKIDIAADTTFYVDSLAVNMPITCIAPVIPLPTIVANSVSINPNPVNNVTNITVNRDTVTDVKIIMYNASGRRIYYKTYNQATVSQINKVNMSGQGLGVYYVVVYANNKKWQTLRVVKAN